MKSSLESMSLQVHRYLLFHDHQRSPGSTEYMVPSASTYPLRRVPNTTGGLPKMAGPSLPYDRHWALFPFGILDGSNVQVSRRYPEYSGMSPYVLVYLSTQHGGFKN